MSAFSDFSLMGDVDSDEDEDHPLTDRTLAKIATVVYAVLKGSLDGEKSERARLAMRDIAKGSRRHLLGQDAVRIEQIDSDSEAGEPVEVIETFLPGLKDGTLADRQVPNALHKARELLSISHPQPISDLSASNITLLKNLVEVGNELFLSAKNLHRICMYYLRGRLGHAYMEFQREYGAHSAVERLVTHFNSEAPRQDYSASIRNWKLSLRKPILPQLHELQLSYLGSKTKLPDGHLTTVIKDKALSQLPQHVVSAFNAKQSRYSYLHRNKPMSLERFAKTITKILDTQPPTRSGLGDGTHEVGVVDHTDPGPQAATTDAFCRQVDQKIEELASTLEKSLVLVDRKIDSALQSARLYDPPAPLDPDSATVEEVSGFKPYSQPQTNYYGARPRHGMSGGWSDHRPQYGSGSANNGTDVARHHNIPDETPVSASSPGYVDGLKANSLKAFNRPSPDDVKPLLSPLVSWNERGQFTPIPPQEIRPVPRSMPILVYRKGYMRYSQDILNHLRNVCPLCALKHPADRTDLCVYGSAKQAHDICKRCHASFHVDCLLSDEYLAHLNSKAGPMVGSHGPRPL